MKGTVKCYDIKKGYGFIKSEDGKEIFVHRSNIQMNGFKSLHKGDLVLFEIVITNNRKYADKVLPVLTRKYVNKCLREKRLRLVETENDYGHVIYRVASAYSNVIDYGQEGQYLEEIAAAYEIEPEHTVA